VKSLRFAALLPVAGIITLCAFTFFSGDDICYRNELARYTVLKKAWLQYLFWDGRSLSIPSLVQLTALKYFPAPFVSLIWTLSFLGSVYLILKILQLDFNVQLNFFSFGILSAILWLGMWKLIPDILYWPTGGWYCMMLLLALIWIYFLNKEMKEQNFNQAKIIFIFILSILCGTNSHNIIIPLIFIAIEKLVYSRVVLKEKKSTQYLLFAIGGLLIGGFMVLLAPGNGERLKAIAWNGFNSEFLLNCGLVFTRYCYWLLALFALLVFLCWMHKKNILNAFSPGRASAGATKWIIAIHQHCYLIAALLSVVVFSATSFFAVPRTALFFGIFITLYILKQFQIDFKADTNRMRISAMVLLVGCSGIIFFEAWKVNSLRQELQLREDIYNLNAGKDVTVEVISESKIPFAFQFVDISPDTNFWVNRCVALDKGLKTVRSTSRLQDQ